MEKDFESWFNHQRSNGRLPKLDSVSSPFNLEKPSTVPAHVNLSSNSVFAKGTSSTFEFSGLPHSNANQLNEPRGCGWFYCLPRFRQAFAPVPSSVPQEKLPSNLVEKPKMAGAPDAKSGCPQKRFLVFDRSGDQTTLIFHPGVGTPVQCPTSWSPQTHGAYLLNKDPGIKRGTTCPYGAVFTDEYGEEDHKDDVGSEMQEDSDELDALLDSDDERYYSEDDEEMSTGHSPGTMTSFVKLELIVESGEEVASSAGPTKRQKLFDGGYDVLALEDTASSVRHKKCFEAEDDAESGCGDGKDRDQVLRNLGSLASNKRSRKDKIRETVGILQTIIPGGKGKDAIVVLDEAINYLRSLKFKAEALGLDNL